MDIVDDNEIVKRCYKCDHQLLDNLNLVYNASNSMVVLWNKYQIFVYENLEFENAAKMFVPEFQIYLLLISNNYLVCLDCSGNVHITSLKFKNAAQKRFKSSFQPREQNIAACVHQDHDHVLSLKFEAESYFLCINRINSDFQLIKKSILICDSDWPLPHLTNKKFVLNTLKICASNNECIKKIFGANENDCTNSNLVIISFDMLTVYGCLFSRKTANEEIPLVKLYTSPSEICNVIDEGGLNIIIGLSIGTLIKLCLNDINKDPQIIHLNIALNKFHIIKDTIIYSDGISLWKSEKTFTDDIQFNQFFVKHVKDFIKCGDQIICTTFSKLMYVFPTDDERVYLKPETVDEYCSAEKLLNNSEYLYRIMEEIEKSKQIVKKLNQETNYITALSLSNRQDLMSNVIKHQVEVYENYEDVIKENQELTLTDEIVEYFIPDSYLFLVKITTSTIQHMFGHVLSNIFGDLKIHITLSSENNVLKTTSIRVLEQLKKINILIPLKSNLTHINLQLRIVSNVPGALDEKETIWTVLYRTHADLNSEHFIKTNLISNKNICLKEWQRDRDDLIHKTVLNQYGNMFKITDIAKHKTLGTEWSYYVKLPKNYEEIFKTEDFCRQYFNAKKANFLIQQYTSQEFLKSKSNISFSIGNDKVKLEIINDSFSNPVLKVTSENIKIAFNIRNFTANMIYNDYKNYGPNKEFINNTFYTTVENLQKSIKDCITCSGEMELYLPLIEQFERNVMGALPL